MTAENTQTGTDDSENDIIGIPRALLNRLLDRMDGLETELSEYRTENEKDKATIRQDVTEAIEKAESGSKAEGDESDEESASDGSMTPMERMLQWGEDTLTKHVTASDRRARAIAQHFGQWASKAPNGLVVKDNLKNLLSTATGESLAWKQIYRAARALEDLTRGAIRFKKHRRHGWMLIGESQVVSQLGRASSASAG